MKIRTQEDIDLLDRRIKEELNVDVRKYKNEEVVEKIVALLVFPEYILTWMAGPVIIGLLIFALGFFVLNLSTLAIVFYAIIGFILFLLTGTFGGLLLLTSKMKTDMKAIVNYSLSMTEAAVVDVSLVNKNTDPAFKKEAYALLFKGIIHIVTVPMTTKAVTEKMPILGRLINGFIRRFFNLISDRVKFDNLQLNSTTNKFVPSQSKSVELYSKSMGFASLGIDKLIGISFGLIRFPLKAIFWIIVILLILFLWLMI